MSLPDRSNASLVGAILVLVVVLLASSGCAGDLATGPTAPKDGETGDRALGLDSAIVWVDAGTAKAVYRGDEASPPRAGGVKREPVDADSIRALRERLDDASREWGDAAPNSTLLFQVADAWSANSKSKFRSALAKLPVRVVTSAASGLDGKHYQRRDYYVHNTLKLSLFLSSVSAEEGRAPVTVVTPDETWCETEFQGTVYVDECATQQDLDDAAVTLAALEYQVDGYQAQFNAGTAQACDSDPDSELCVIMQAPPRPASADCAAGAPAAVGGDGCAMEAMSATAAFWGFGAAKVSAHGLMMRGASVTARRALFVGLGGAVSGAFSVGFAVGSFLGCIEAKY